MQQRDIVKKINTLLEAKEKLQAIKYVSDLAGLVRDRRPMDFGLLEAKNSIDTVMGYENPGKIWLNRLRVDRPAFYQELRYIKYEDLFKV